MKYNTGKKKQIIDFLSANSHTAFTLEEISERVTESGKGKSTVYRIVSELVEEAEVKRISDGKTRHCSYQYIGGTECKSHLHLKCRGCGRLIHLDKEVSESFTAAVRDRGSFMLEDGCILFGKCENCKIPEKSHNHSHVGGCV